MQELYADGRSVIHQTDARVKLILTLVLIILFNLTPARAWPAYILFFSVILSVALLSRLGLGFMLKRSLLATPFILAALPLIFTGPQPHLTFPLWNGLQLNYSPEGLMQFFSIAIKSWISIQAAILLTATTRFPELLTGLQQLKVPKLFIAIIGLMWRYLFVISDEVTRMLRARASRSATIQGQHARLGIIWRAQVTGSMAGSLFLRSIERSDCVYAAMVSRGYNGAQPTYESTPLTIKDYSILALGCLVLTLLWTLGVLTGG